MAALTITPLLPHLAARVEGPDLARPVDDATFRKIFDAFQAHSVLVCHGQRLTDDEQMQFSERFGPLETTLLSGRDVPPVGGEAESSRACRTRSRAACSTPSTRTRRARVLPTSTRGSSGTW